MEARPRLGDVLQAHEGQDVIEPPLVPYDGAAVSALRPGGTAQTRCLLNSSAPDVESRRWIFEALKQCIDAHGPITRQNLSSANKRMRPVGSDE